MKKYIQLVILTFVLLLLSACSQGEEDTEDYSGIIGDGRALGYEYTVTKEQTTFSWEVGYKGATTVIEENAKNKSDLEKFMIAINDSKSKFVTLILSVSYLLIVVITTLVLYKKKSEMIKDGGLIILIAAAGIAIYIAINASLDLSSLLREANYYYWTLVT